MTKLRGCISVKRLFGVVNFVAGQSSLSGNLQEKTVTPSVAAQTVTPDGGYGGLSRVHVEATPLQDKTVAPSTGGQIVQADDGSVGLGTVTVQAAALQAKTAAPDYAAQEITPDAGFYGLSLVTVEALAFRETFKVEEVNSSSDGEFSATFADGSTVSGTVTFDANGVPTGLTDDQGNVVTFGADGWPTGLTDKDGNTVTMGGG